MKAYPPLKAIAVFDAVMRSHSFTIAAEELNVTPGAVGQQMRKLEEWLGTSLFIRQVRQVIPTADARIYWAQIKPSLARLHQASWMLRDQRNNGVWLSLPPTFAAKWFAPRMAKFIASNIDIALHVSSSSAMVDFAHNAVDIAVRYFGDNDPELDTYCLFKEKVIPLCSPDYAAKLGGLTRQHLANATLLHNAQHDHWQQWFDRYLPESGADTEAMTTFYFDNSIVAIEAAKNHQGVVLASRWQVPEELATGELVALDEEVLDTQKGFYIVHPKGLYLRPAVATLKEWLLSQISEEA
ncbi:LysR substrate-binding domain-containing protein [Pokkaliibacter sp. CJK22405]|uniref:LysR substrate-binding domain-containing protein n=1 Tax=Pokkaliibacter sp. CJK22405 TaxID=3384615 RepID=UPI0039849D9C